MNLPVVISLFALFLTGFIQDALSGYYLRLVNEHRVKMAVFISFVHSMIAWAIWLYFMYQFQQQETMSGVQAVVHSFGGAMGTALALRSPNKSGPGTPKG